MSELIVNEMFGPTLQGEGPHAGEPALFVRLGRCNLTCQWCDTPYSWDWKRYRAADELRHWRSSEIVLWALERRVSGLQLVVLTGGEPMLQHHRLADLTRELWAEGFYCDVETNGTMPPDPEMSVRTYVVSPKLANSGVANHHRIVPKALEAFDAAGNAVLKFVVEQRDDLDEAAAVAALAPSLPVWVLPQAVTVAELLQRTQALADAVVRRGWHMSGRLHLMAWGASRGH